MDKAAIINLCVEKGKLEALVFLSLYLEYKGTKRGLSIFSESKKITVQMKNWNPVKVVNCIASAEKICGEELKKIMERIIQLCQSFNWSQLMDLILCLSKIRHWR